MKKLLIFLLILVLLFFLYAKYGSQNILLVNEYSIISENLPNGFDGTKIVHFSDLYYDGNEKVINKLIDKINEQNPDIVIFTGDLLKEKINKKEQEFLKNSLSKINYKLKKYAILGDKDDDVVENILNESDFTVLKNEQDLLFNNDITPISIINNSQIDEEKYSKESFNIFLVHKPDEVDKILKYNPSLILAGHSLGGQIRIPFWGALIKTKGSLKYSNDYYESDNTKIYISYGVGYGNIGLRLFNDPSFNVYRLKCK